MSFLLRRTDKLGTHVYVAPPGSRKGYVTKEKARVFSTRAEAESNRCPDNEVIVHQNETQD